MNIKNSIATITILAIATLGFTGCGPVEASSQPAPEASVAQPVEEKEETAEPSVVNEYVKQFGEVFTWEDGVSISISEPAAFQASEYAMGATPGQEQVIFTIVLTNGTSEVLDPVIFTTGASGGSEAALIFDSGNEVGAVGQSPSTSLLPDQTVKWYVAFSVADPTNITVETSPGFGYENVIFTNIAP